MSTTISPTDRVASEKQVNFILRLANDREVPVAGRSEKEAIAINTVECCQEQKTITHREAGITIDYLLAAPKSAKGAATKADVGCYIMPDGTIVKVQENRAKTNRYAMRWIVIGGERLVDATEAHVHGEWTYDPALIFQVNATMRMTLEQAKHFILRYGRCVRCGRKLKAAESVEQGIGPVCRNYFTF